MNEKRNQSGRRWSIVLAGGRGERLASFTERWLGRYVPKQYCAFTGKRSMLEHTLERASRVSRPEDIVTVVAREHGELARSQVRDPFARGLVRQPVNRDTAAGIFLPLARVRRADPEATVVVFPSDHFVHPADRFVDTVSAALGAVERMQAKLVLVGVVADDPEPDYGWIFPGRDWLSVEGRPVRAVRSFLEKPSARDAGLAREEGALWNTMVMAAKVDTLWRLGWTYLPQIMFRFEALFEAMETPMESEVTASLYRDMPRFNFSADLLQRARTEVGVVELQDTLWSDWGRAERIAKTLGRIGRKPVWLETAETVEAGVPAALPFAVAGT